MRVRHETHHGRVVRAYVDRPRHLDAMVRAAVDEAGERPAVVEGATRTSYLALDARVGRIAGNLARLGVAKGDRVAIMLGNRLAFVEALLAVLRIGGIVVPMSIRQRAPETAYIVAHAGAKVLIHESDLAAEIPALSAMPTVGHVFDELLTGLDAPASAPVVEIDEDETACILYTSGTTGRPKGAMLTHFGIIQSCLHFEACMDLRRGVEVSILAVPASHVTGLVAIILTMIRTAGAVVLMAAFKARAFLELASRSRVTTTVMVPAMYNLALLDPEFRRFDLSAWRVGGYGGAPMPEATIARLAQALPGLALMNSYGSTEVTSPAAIMPIGEGARRADSVGKTVPNGDIRIMDPSGREVSPGMPGEIWIGGPMVVPGYWDNPAANAQGFVGGYWKSGDLGSLDAEGYVRVFDRIKDMINRGGYKIYSAEVENALAHHADVVECAVVGYPDPVLGERVAAFVVPSRPGVLADELRAYLGARLSDYKVPERILFLDGGLPRNPNGKILKTALRERLT